VNIVIQGGSATGISAPITATHNQIAPAIDPPSPASNAEIPRAEAAAG